KPGNVFLRLEFPEGADRFEPAHRDPEVAPIITPVVIDFGTARAFRPAKGEALSGTLGFFPREQVIPDALLDERTDVFALAATGDNAMTGRTFNESRVATAADPTRAYYAGLLLGEPLDEPGATRGLPAPLVALLRDATRGEASERIDLATFRKRF